MPHCLNNPKRIYKGTEPSPKGLGFCASGEKEGKKMKGKDTSPNGKHPHDPLCLHKKFIIIIANN